MGSQDSWWTISVASLVIVVSAVLVLSCGQTHITQTRMNALLPRLSSAWVINRYSAVEICISNSLINKLYKVILTVYLGLCASGCNCNGLRRRYRTRPLQAGSNSAPMSARQGRQVSYLVDCCTPVSDIASRWHLRSASRHHLTVPRHRLSTSGRRAFSVAGPTV